VIIFDSIQFLYKKITKLIKKIKPNQNQFKPISSVFLDKNWFKPVWFGFFDFAWFWLSLAWFFWFGSVFSGFFFVWVQFGLVFSVSGL